MEATTVLAPVDIVWVVDGSSSMDEESRLVQDNVNAFAAAIAASGTDYHVVIVWNPTRGYTVPPPLGTDTSRLRIVGEDVNSDEPLSDLLGRFGDYADFLRPDAITHFIQVTDDESAMGAGSFASSMSSALGHGFTSHAIVSPPGSGSCGGFALPGADCGCSGPYGDAAADGEEYWTLAASTGGTQLSICSPDWTGLFATLASSIGVPRPVPCELETPEPPAGTTFDPSLTNVVYTPGDGSPNQTIPYVESAAACPATGLAWHYDDPASPTRIVLCPGACTVVGEDPSARLDVALGCQTLLL